MENVTIALTGNPNSGKTSVFNELTGANQYVGNWPGVTVEKKEGRLKKEKAVFIQDLPGIYSLSPYSPEEVVTREYLLNDSPDAILNVVDATNLERNLYLTTQLLELGVPVVIALNMIDLVKKQGDVLNTEKLAYGLGVPVVATSALKHRGIDQVINLTVEKAQKRETPVFPRYDDRLEAALVQIEEIIAGKVPDTQIRWFSIKLFERETSVQQLVSLTEQEDDTIEEIILITEKIFGDDSESIVVNERYDWLEKMIALAQIEHQESHRIVSDRIDKVVTNRWLALPIFAFVMWLVYYLSIQTIGTMGTDYLNDVVFGDYVPNMAQAFLSSLHVAEWLQSLILNGIIAGVGAVLGFVPQLAVLFLCLAFLEDCGYMSRIAFVMDRFFRKFGLSGKSFIPMLVATGCGVPGVMASRTIENEKDRRMTVMVTTFMPCSAKLPIIALISGAFFPKNSWVAPSAYFVGIGAIVISGIMLKKTKLFSGDPAPFIMELPSYHLPNLKGILIQTWDRTKSFVKKAGSIIFVCSILIWFTSSYNFQLQSVSENHSILASFGNLFAFLFAPLGWGNWRATVATITGLVAKENVVNTFGILYGGMKEVSENGNEIWPLLQKSFTPLSGYSFLLFNLLCAPCFAAIGAIHRELVMWKWTLIAVGYQCGLAYVVSFVAYQLGHWLVENGIFGVGQVSACLCIAFIIYALVRKPKRVKSLSIQNLSTTSE
ncbi:ferrous iron transport protein B [Vagococcus entomophilus]|uniref:Ferrous iron transport protein B n=1 Tax=Vagococcus entomophilus TaxID=1160095 RepID=A0A430AFJ0_9ENTE|nr:ferrous iron transport protein B [Vagococcus entomophilus]RSU06496.1 ferrous iron transport protein B [Vagococcus entomophilus]